MTKKILLPTDFSIDSLVVLKTYFQNSQPLTENYEITLLHGYSPQSDSIRDLLFFSKSKVLNDLKINNFLDALEIIKSKFGAGIKNVRIDIFTGYTSSAFENYITGNNIEEIVFSDQLKFKPASKRSFDLTRIIQKSKTLPVVNLNINNEKTRKIDPQNQDLTALFSTSA